MKRRQRGLLFLGCVIVLLCSTCWRTAKTPDVPDALICREHTSDSASWQSWSRSATSSGVSRNGLVSDGDLLWISTSRGLVRLDVQTWQCDLFTIAAGQSLAGAHPVLPDGAGGLWVGVIGRVLHFSGGEWQVIYEVPEGHPRGISALGLGQTGSLCIQLYSRSMRCSYAFHRACLAGNTFPLDNTPFIPSYSADETENCNLWQQVSGRRYNYTTPAACMRIQRIEPGYSDSIAVSADGNEVWMTKYEYNKRDRLFHWRGETVEWDWIPYQDVDALTIDPVRGGAWMATEDGLVHVRSETVVESGDTSSPPSVSPAPHVSPLVSLSPLPSPQPRGDAVHTRFTFQPIAFSAETFPGMAHGLTVDQSGRVWAVSGDKVLRYDEAVHGWRTVVSLAHGADAIGADPERGIWAAGRGELVYFDGEQRYTWPTSDDYRDKPTALLVGENGRVWLGTLERGVWTAIPRVQSATSAGRRHPVLDWRRFTVKDGLASELITALARGPDERIYAAHYAGISVLEPADGVENGRWTTLPGSDASRSGWINALAFAPSQAGGGLWAGYHHSKFLRRYQDGRWADYRLPPGVGDETRGNYYRAVQGIGALLVDEDGTLWVGTIEGLRRWPAAGEGGKLRWQMFDPDVLTMRDVLALAQDAQGRIWVGGEEGVAMWEGDQ